MHASAGQQRPAEESTRNLGPCSLLVSSPTGIPGILRDAVLFAIFRATDARKFSVETRNPESNLRRARTHTWRYGVAHG